MNKWLKTALMAAGGGAVTAGLAALVDPSKFNFHDGTDGGHIAEMALEGAAVAVAGVFLNTPFGKKVLQKSQQEDK